MSIDWESQLERLRTALEEADLQSISDKLLAQARPGIRLACTPAPDEAIPIGSSKLFGGADVPPGFDWPAYEGKPLLFIAQIDLEELPFPGPLPEKGLLSFFFDAERAAWGFDPKHREGARVFYAPDGSSLARHSIPYAKLPTRGILSKLIRFWRGGVECDPKSARVQFAPTLSLPDPLSDEFAAIENSEDPREEAIDRYCELTSHIDAGARHQLFGHAHIIQNPMELECQLVSHGIYCGDSKGHESPRAKELAAGAKDWSLLFQVDSDDDLGLMWGDAGLLYFWIRRQDLQQLAFDKAWAILQCH